MNNQAKLTSYLTDIQGMVNAGMGRVTIRSNSFYILEELGLKPDNAQLLTDVVMEVVRDYKVKELPLNDFQRIVGNIIKYKI